ncbi:hypothetical protein PaeBR_16400 [Paenibacillus sp. BR2-3]|uniref:hypothetical protein n=1 Tax=Paenibacillus sp. BR2-3 TaxID=3048494 RepID=UPI0039774B49
MYKDNLMNKSCSCGGIMTIHMHTLIYSAKVKITGVPVYTCRACSRYEPLPCIKKDLGKLISELGDISCRRHISFAERNEWASVLKETFAGFNAGDLTDLEGAILSAVQSRIDLLLDLYRLASNYADHKWMEETGLRLSQLTLQSPERAK